MAPSCAMMEWRSPGTGASPRRRDHHMPTVRRLSALLTACLLAMLAAGCGNEASTSPEGTWTGAEDTHLDLSADGTVTGNDGCNHIGGSWEEDGEQIGFSDMIATLMACPDVEVWRKDPRTVTSTEDTMVVCGAGAAARPGLRRAGPRAPRRPTSLSARRHIRSTCHVRRRRKSPCLVCGRFV